MSDWTPGPWHISKFPIHVHDTEIQGPNCQHIASLMRLGFTTRAERHANATLISAAPDLLAGCKEAYRYFDNPEGKLSDEEMSGIYMMLRDAIAKATEQPESEAE